MALLTADQSLQNVLTSATARILDVFQLLYDADAIGAISLPGQNQATAAFLKGKIFFMDQVEVEDASDEIALVDIEGPAVGMLLPELGLDHELTAGQVVSIDLDGTRVRVIAQSGLTAELGLRLLLPRTALGALQARLGEMEVEELSEAGHEALRIEAGQPKSGHELTQDYTPLETNLAAAISDTKGCYTGQEIIARQITYDKITKRLVQIKFDAEVEVGAKVMAAGKKAGVITSAVNSPRRGALALAVLKRPHEQDGTTVTVVDEEGEVQGTVKSLLV